MELFTTYNVQCHVPVNTDAHQRHNDGQECYVLEADTKKGCDQSQAYFENSLNFIREVVQYPQLNLEFVNNARITFHVVEGVDWGVTQLSSDFIPQAQKST